MSRIQYFPAVIKHTERSDHFFLWFCEVFFHTLSITLCSDKGRERQILWTAQDYSYCI